MVERNYDKSLWIKTTGIREWKDRSIHYNRCESTPYMALKELFKRYKLNKTDRLVDFGCGRGRVAFYVHNRFKIPVTGVEVHDTTFDEVLNNKASYRHRFQDIAAPIRFEYGLAEHYEIEPMDNKFYFFNPFSIKIFKKVVGNILHSVKRNRRTVDIILYYPMPEYKLYLKKSTSFKLINKIRVPEASDSREKFLIYRLKDLNMA
ncbi:MAG TPA: class I SAM-dependent methyltransferase [Tepidimicrobium sp.]|nr:class I SAM-dependent methyltransferase [Tepidimicrobium sp.]